MIWFALVEADGFVAQFGTADDEADAGRQGDGRQAVILLRERPTGNTGDYLFEGGALVPRDPPPPVEMPPVIAEVTPAQAKTALYDAGLYDEVEAALAAHPYPLVRIWWVSAQVWRRDHPYVAGIAAQLGLSDDDVDQLFDAAAKVVT